MNILNLTTAMVAAYRANVGGEISHIELSEPLWEYMRLALDINTPIGTGNFIWNSIRICWTKGMEPSIKIVGILDNPRDD